MTSLRSWRWTVTGLGSDTCCMAISVTWGWVEAVGMEWPHLYGKGHPDWTFTLSFPAKRSQSSAAACCVPVVYRQANLMFCYRLKFIFKFFIFFSFVANWLSVNWILKRYYREKQPRGWLFLPKMDEMMNEHFHLHKQSAERASPNVSIHIWWHPDCNHK